MDLAPRYIYYYWLIGLSFGPVFITFLITNWHRLIDTEALTTLVIIIIVELIGLILLMTKCKYVVHCDDPKYFIYGDVSRQNKIQKDRLFIKTIYKKLGLYKVDTADTSFFILTENQLVDSYLNR